MSKRAFARAFRASTALCGILAAVPVAAQVAPPAPVRQSIDANGVDLFHGTFQMKGPTLSIGGEDQGLSYVRINRGTGWTDNIVATIRLSGSTMTVSLGGYSDRFTVSGGSYLPTEGNGATLSFNTTTKIYTYTRSDGTVILFNQALRNEASGPYADGANEGRVTTITSPNGAKLTFGYGSINYCASTKEGSQGPICLRTATARRLSGVRSNYGYSIGFDYDELDPYDPTDPYNMPNPYTFSLVRGVTASNSASPVGSPSISQTFANTVTGQTEITDALGRTTKYIGNATTTTITRPGSTSPDITVTKAGGRVTALTTAAGTTGYAASDAGGLRTVTVTDPLSHATSYTFDIASQRMLSVTNALSQTTSYQYDTSGRMTRITQPEGNYTQITYDARGNVTERRAVAKAGSGLADIVTSASYPASCTNPATCNQPVTTTDARGAVTDYTYDTGHGGVTSITAPAPSVGAVRPQTRYGYSSLQAYYRVSAGGPVASGEPVVRITSVSACQTLASCAGTADEVKTTIGYGPQATGTGNNLLPVSISQGAGDGSLTATTSYSYDTIGNRVVVDGPLAGPEDSVHSRYDAVRQPVGMIGPDPDGAGARKRAASRMTYDAKGRVTLAERGTVAGVTDPDWAAFVPAEAVATSYDGVDRKLSETLIAGGVTYGVTQHSYLGHRLDCSAVRLNPAAWGSLPPSTCTAQTAGAAGPDRISKISYDNADRVTLVQTAYGVTGQQADEVATTYSDNGQALTLTDAEGSRTTYEYDGHDRLAKTRYPSPTTDGVSSTTDYAQPTYDANGNVTTMRLRDGQQIAMTYDALNRPTFKDVPNVAPYEYDVTYTYDLFGRLRSATDSNTHLAAFGYDALGRKISEQSNWTTRSWQYDLAGRRTRLTWGDGFYVTYDHDVAGNMTAIRENGAASGVGVLASYGYDDLGRRTSVTRGNGTTTGYGYDAVSRLASLGHDFAGTGHDLTLGFTYNPAGQIASSTRNNDVYYWGGHYNKDVAETTNGLNQLTAQGSTALGYDGRGNVSAIGGAAYGYTSENRLASAPGGVNMTHDPLGRYHWISGGAVTWMQYDGASIIEERDANGVARRYVHGPGTDEPIVWYEGSGATDRRWLHADERGSIIAVSNASGVVTASNAYDDYGVPASTNVGRFQYTGQAWLPEIGMYHYKARTYAPKLGRFLQADPIGYMAGMNLYGYVSGDPINRIDPTGMTDVMCGDGGTAASAAGCDGRGGVIPDIEVTGRRPENEQREGPEIRLPSLIDQIIRVTLEPTWVEGMSIASGRKGERNRAAKPSGTPDPYKKIRAHPTKKGWIKYKDQNGKSKERPGTPDELRYLQQKSSLITDGARVIIPFGAATVMCALAPATCGIADVDGNNVIDGDDWSNY